MPTALKPLLLAAFTVPFLAAVWGCHSSDPTPAPPLGMLTLDDTTYTLTRGVTADFTSPFDSSRENHNTLNYTTVNGRYRGLQVQIERVRGTPIDTGWHVAYNTISPVVVYLDRVPGLGLPASSFGSLADSVHISRVGGKLRYTFANLPENGGARRASGYVTESY